MSYSERLANRIRDYLVDEYVVEKRMFGALCFMVNDKMCVCVGDDTMLCRLGQTEVLLALNQDGISPMVMAGRTSKNYIRIDINLLKSDVVLKDWVDKALAFNEQLTKIS